MDNKLPPQVRCSVCQTVSDFADCIKEETLPYGDIVEGIVTCPSCGDRRHIYFMTGKIRSAQAHLASAASLWNNRKIYENYNQMVIARNRYTTIFEEEQERCKEILEKATAEDGN